MEMKLRMLEMIYLYQKIGKRTLSLFLACLMIMGLAAPALSVTFAVVTTESAFEDGKLTSELSDFTMTVSYSSEALIPDSAVLVVHDVTE